MDCRPLQDSLHPVSALHRTPAVDPQHPTRLVGPSVRSERPFTAPAPGCRDEETIPRSCSKEGAGQDASGRREKDPGFGAGGGSWVSLGHRLGAVGWALSFEWVVPFSCNGVLSEVRRHIQSFTSHQLDLVYRVNWCILQTSEFGQCFGRVCCHILASGQSIDPGHLGAGGLSTNFNSDNSDS